MFRKCRFSRWRPERRLPRRFREAPEEFTDLRTSDCRPMLFTAKRPAPLRDVASLSDVLVDDVAMTRHNSEDVAQQPLALVSQDRMGLPNQLVQYLEHRFLDTDRSLSTSAAATASAAFSSREFQGFTVAQARILHHMYATQDVAVCAPTGTGKTFALCLGVIARLMREGPMKLFSTVILVNSDYLSWQVEKWLQDMWWYPNDDRLVFAATSNLSEDHVYRRLTKELVRDAHQPRRIIGTVDNRPYIVVTTPEVLWRYYTRRRAAILRRESSKNRKGYSFSLTPVLSTVDLIIVDEVDEVMPSTKPNAAGNLLLKEVFRYTKYQAPLQIIFTSATLAGSTVNHVRRYMKKNLLADRTARVFDEAKESATRLAAITNTISRAAVPSNIKHLFYTADTLEEQRQCIAKVFQASCPSFHFLVGARGCGGDAAAEHRDHILLILPDSANVEKFIEKVLLPSQSDALRELGAEHDPTCSAFLIERLDHTLQTQQQQRRRAETVKFLKRTVRTRERGGEGKVGVLPRQERAMKGPDRGPSFTRLEREVNTATVVAENTIGSAKQPHLSSKSACLSRGGTSNGDISPSPSTLLSVLPRRTFITCCCSSVRGLDLPHLTHVIILAHASSALEYAHWCGRVGRFGHPGVSVTVMARSATRQLHQFCDALGISFNVQRRHAAVDVDADRRLSGVVDAV